MRYRKSFKNLQMFFFFSVCSKVAAKGLNWGSNSLSSPLTSVKKREKMDEGGGAPDCCAIYRVYCLFNFCELQKKWTRLLGYAHRLICYI